MDKNDVKQLIDKYSTPLYVFDVDKAIEQVEKFKKVINGSALICYAMKANPFIVKLLEPFVDYLEVCSPGEFAVCENAKVCADKIVMSGVNKTEKDVFYAVKTYGNSIIYTAESKLHYKFLWESAKKTDQKIRVLLRLSAGNQFGMDKQDITDVIAQSNTQAENVDICGIHYFSGTQKKSPTRYEKELSELDDLLDKLNAEHGYTAERLEYGAGLPACYFEGEEDKQDEMLSALKLALDNMRYKGKKVIELGRYVASSCGYYCTSVCDQKVIAGETYAICDGGINHLNYYGQMLAMKKPFIDVIYGEQTENTQNVTVCGSLCTANDVLLKNYAFNGLQIGDKIIFKNTGAYSVTEGISLFLTRDLPAVVTKKGNEINLARPHTPTDKINY